MKWWNSLRGKVKFREPLKKYTTFRIGGPAKLLFEPRDSADLQCFVRLARRKKIPFFVLGAGSNVLAADRGVPAAVVRLAAPGLRWMRFFSGGVEVGAALKLQDLLRASVERGFCGGEFLAGIPGTVGGALAMNAGAWGSCIADLVENVTIIDYNGALKVVPKGTMGFGYRASRLGRSIIVSVRLKLGLGPRQRSKKKIKAYLTRRRLTQDYSGPSAGCVFKNPKTHAAGALLDLCGLKGARVGDASISLKHANFIINRGNATADDVFSLMRLAEKKVKEKFSITLQPEIKIWK